MHRCVDPSPTRLRISRVSESDTHRIKLAYEIMEVTLLAMASLVVRLVNLSVAFLSTCA